MGDELSLLPETRQDDVEDVVWGLQTATTLWGRGEKREALVWLRRAAEAAGAAGADMRAVELAKRAVELEQLFALQSSSSIAPTAPPPTSPGVTPSVPPVQAKPPLPKPPVLAELLDADDLVDEETQERTLPGVAHGPGSIPPAASIAVPSTAPAVSVAQDQAALAALNKTQPLPIVAHPLASTQVSAPSSSASQSSMPAVTPPAPSRPAPSRPSTTALPAMTTSPPIASVAPASAPSASASPAASQPISAPAEPVPSAAPPVASVRPAEAQTVAAASSSPVSARVAPQPSAAPAPSPTPSPAPAAAAPPPPAAVTQPASTPLSRAAVRKKQRAPILDPWSDDIPDEPAPRTIGHRTDNFTDEDVITSAPSVDFMLKRKAPPPPPPPPMKRSATLTGGPDGPTLEAARSKLANLADDGAARGTPAPPPTRKPTLPPGSVAALTSEARKSIPPLAPNEQPERTSVPPPPLDVPPRSERKSVPPPPPRERRTTPPPASGPLPGSAAPNQSPNAPAPSAPLFGNGLPTPPPSAASSEHKTDPPPATMPAAQQLATRSAGAPPAPPAPAPPAPAPPPPPAPPAPAPPAPATPPPPAPPAPAPATPSPPAPQTPPPPAPPAPASAEPAPPAPQPKPAAPAPTRAPTVPPEARSVGNLVLDRVEGFGDLPSEVQVELAKSAKIVELAVDEEVSGFGVALLLSGSAVVCPTIADAAALALEEAALAPALTAHPDGSSIRVVATMPSRVATWDKAVIESCLRSCPWVLEDLVARGDRVAALTGATMGPLGDLDESSRFMTLENLSVRSLAPAEVLVAAAGEVAGLTIVGLGSIVQGAGDATFGAGDVVLAGSVLEGGPAPAEIKAGPEGALVLVATRMKTLELFSTIPSLIELLRVT